VAMSTKTHIVLFGRMAPLADTRLHFSVTLHRGTLALDAASLVRLTLGIGTLAPVAATILSPAMLRLNHVHCHKRSIRDYCFLVNRKCWISFWRVRRSSGNVIVTPRAKKDKTANLAKVSAPDAYQTNVPKRYKTAKTLIMAKIRYFIVSNVGESNPCFPCPFCAEMISSG
jgi:hypothetical protein